VNGPEKIAEAVFAAIGAWFALSVAAAAVLIVLRRAGWRIR